MTDILKQLPVEKILDFVLKFGFEKFLALLSFLFVTWLCVYLIRKNSKNNLAVNQELLLVKKDQEACHKDREELKIINHDLNREIKEARDMNRDLNRLNKESQKRISEYQAAQTANSEMLKDVFTQVLNKLDK